MVVLIVVHKIGRRLFLYVKIQKNIYLMYAISLFQGMVFYASVATLYRQARGISVFQITLIESISLLLCLFMEIPWGIIADQIGYRKAMIFCCLLYVVSKIIFWQADDFAMFLLERILLSIVFAGMSGVDTSILYLSCKSEKSQHAFAIYDMLGTLGLLFSAFIFFVFVKTFYGMFLRPKPKGLEVPDNEVPKSAVFAMVVLLALIIILGLCPGLVTNGIYEFVGGIL